MDFSSSLKKDSRIFGLTGDYLPLIIMNFVRTYPAETEHTRKDLNLHGVNCLWFAYVVNMESTGRLLSTDRLLPLGARQMSR